MTASRSRVAQPVDVDTESLRNAIRDEYREVAERPGKGFHFHTGRRLTRIVGYKDEWLKGAPAAASIRSSLRAWSAQPEKPSVSTCRDLQRRPQPHSRLAESSG